MMKIVKFAGKELGVNMRKLVQDCLLLRVLEHSTLIMDLFEQRRTSSIKARRMAYLEE
jgi:hypothetical protein